MSKIKALLVSLAIAAATVLIAPVLSTPAASSSPASISTVDTSDAPAKAARKATSNIDYTTWSGHAGKLRFRCWGADVYSEVSPPFSTAWTCNQTAEVWAKPGYSMKCTQGGGNWTYFGSSSLYPMAYWNCRTY